MVGESGGAEQRAEGVILWGLQAEMRAENGPAGEEEASGLGHALPRSVVLEARRATGRRYSPVTQKIYDGSIPSCR